MIWLFCTPSRIHRYSLPRTIQCLSCQRTSDLVMIRPPDRILLSDNHRYGHISMRSVDAQGCQDIAHSSNFRKEANVQNIQLRRGQSPQPKS